MSRRANYATPEAKTQFLNDLRAYVIGHFKRFAKKNPGVAKLEHINEFCEKGEYSYPTFLFNKDTNKPIYRHAFGLYGFAPLTDAEMQAEAPTQSENVVEEVVQGFLNAKATEEDSFVPPLDPCFVAHGFYADLKNIIDSGIFYPIYITGESGNGKTLGTIQACAELTKEMVRVNITKDTDELDLFGSHELVSGNTVRREGPVITAMKRGALLLLDETDYGSERLLCMQPVLEGKPFLDKKTNTVVYPAPGFNIIACANTKGKGSNDGRFIGANTLNEAFLERFAITVEQEYPPEDVELEILNKNFDLLGILNKDTKRFAKCLTQWATLIRKTYADGGINEVISTRRLVHIVVAYGIFKDRAKAIKLCLNRFDKETQVAFLDFYSKIDDLEATTTAPRTTGASDAKTKKWTGPQPVSTVDFDRLAATLGRQCGKAVSINQMPEGKLQVVSHGFATTDVPTGDVNKFAERCVELHKMQAAGI